MFPRLPTTERLAFAGIACLVVGGAAYVGFSRTEKPAPIVFDNKPPIELETPAKPEVIVHVVGEVNKPGVYHLTTGSRVEDAIKAAGGPKANAAMEEWNLAATVIDASQIYIHPKQARRAPGKNLPQASAPAKLDGTMPPLRVDVPKAYQGGPQAPSAYEGKLTVQPEPLSKTTASPTSTGTRKALPAPGSIDLNTATEAELQRLPGVGPSMATKILDYRREHGRFASVEELLAVKGIGPKKLDALRDYVRI